MHVEPNGSTQICCASTYKHEHNKSIGNLETQSPTEIWNNSLYKNIRKEMLAGNKLPEFCNACYFREKANTNDSERQRFNREFAHAIEKINETKPDGHYELLDLRYLDIRFNNLCNLKCRTCGPDWSTSWANEVNEEKVLQYNDSWKKLLPYTENLEKIYFAGGEPLMMKEHYDFLESLLQKNSNVELLYTSNFTRLQLGGRHVMDYWPKFKLVNAVASIDHVNEQCSYVRSGSNYSTIKANFIKVKNAGHNNIRPAVTTVVSAYNITKIGSIVETLFNDGLLDNMNQIVFNFLVDPKYQQASIIPTSAYNHAINNINNGIEFLEKHNHDISKLVSIRSWLEQEHKYNEPLFKKFVNYNKSLDKIRNTSFEKFYTEYCQ
jgi:uncharacterized radical SAM superfamily Fe-S cluster-containing enzyme